MILKCDNNFTRILEYVIQASDQACLTGLSNLCLIFGPFKVSLLLHVVAVFWGQSKHQKKGIPHHHLGYFSYKP